MRDIYAEVTAKVVAAVEAGTPPWHKPWASGGPSRPTRSTGQAYRGINTVVLWTASMLRGFDNPYWFTFNQARDLGAAVKKGAKAEPVVFWKQVEAKAGEQPGGDDDAEEGAGRGRRMFMRYFSVFNAEEIEGLPDRFRCLPPAPKPFVAHERAEKTMAATGAKISLGGGRAFYSPGNDSIRLPARESFDSPERFYGTAFHELVHWTGVEKRCARQFGKRFGDDAYAVEELVAEMGAAFLCADHAIATCPREDHASYIASWLKVLKADSKAIFSAAAAAEKAASFILAAGDAAELPVAA